MSDGFIPTISVLDEASVASGTPIATLNPKKDGKLEITVEFDTAAAFGVIITPEGGSPMDASLFNLGASLVANAVYTFTVGCRSGAIYDFRHTLGSSIKVKQFLVDLITRRS